MIPLNIKLYPASNLFLYSIYFKANGFVTMHKNIEKNKNLKTISENWMKFFSKKGLQK